MAEDLATSQGQAPTSKSNAVIPVMSEGFVKDPRLMAQLRLFLERSDRLGPSAAKAVLEPLLLHISRQEAEEAVAALSDSADNLQQWRWQRDLQTCIAINGYSTDQALKLPHLVVEGTARAMAGMGELPTDQELELPSFMVPFEDQARVIQLLESGKAVLLSGMAGSGKTTLAKSVLKQLRQAHPTLPMCYVSVEWASASPSNTELLKAQQALLERLAAVKVEPESLEAGRALLAKNLKGRKVLLVVDNAQVSYLGHLLTCKGEDGKDTTIMELLAPGSMVLITSRARQAAHSFHNCKVLEEVQMTFLPKPQAQQLLMRHAYISPAAELAPVVEVLLERCGGLPLAVEVVGTSLQPNNTGLWKDGQDGEGCLVEEALQHAYADVRAGTGRTLFETLQLTWEEDMAGGVEATLLDIVRCGLDSRRRSMHLGRLEERCLVSRCQGAHGFLEPPPWVPNAVVNFCKMQLGGQGSSAVGQEASKSHLQMQVDIRLRSPSGDRRAGAVAALTKHPSVSEESRGSSAA